MKLFFLAAWWRG